MIPWTVRALAYAALSLSAGCGAKTGLRVEEPAFEAGTDAREVVDVGDVVDAVDGPRDAPTACADGAENVYVLGGGGQLYEFLPASSSARFIANVRCGPQHGGFNSMAVARDGTAYAAAQDGTLIAIHTRDGSCAATPFADSSFGVFCMGFSLQGIDDVLFISSCHETPYRLGRIDTSTFALTSIGAMTPAPENGVELTGDRNGNVYGFWDGGGFIALGRIDPRTATMTNVVRLPFRTFSAFAFAQWGGDFFFFANGVNGSDVVRYHPPDGSYAIVTHVPVEVVGAGVSTCAPGG